MKKAILFWILSFAITIGSAIYQRKTGPTHPISGSVNFNGKKIDYVFDRSNESTSNCVVQIKTGDPAISGVLKWRKFGTLDPFNVVEMKGSETLKAEIPAQEPLEKLQYFVELRKDKMSITVPEDKPVIIRFKGHVPLGILVPHIFFMFFAMMLSTRSGFEFFNNAVSLKKLAVWTLVVLFIGGFPLGFLMNYFAFGQVWGGFPYGNDITDNKTLIAFIGWLLAYYMIKKEMQPKLFAALAAILMIVVYSIPHSA